MTPGADELRRWGIDPAWSCQVEVPAASGPAHRWHVLDTGPPDRVDERGAAPVVCVHGNPTWSWMWASFLRRLGAGRRVVAPDLLGMGYSDRPADARPFSTRVDDLDDLLGALGIDGPIVLAAHDWGGAIAMGWAVGHPERVEAMVLANTGIAVPAGRRAPAVIRLAASRGVRDLVTRRTSVFVRGTGRLSGRRLGAADREALVAPYRSADRRRAIADFVGDVPLAADHPSAGPLDDVAGRLGGLDAPVLLLWGGRDPVFDDDFAGDLLGRFRRADVHRFPSAGHLVVVETAGSAWPGPSAADVASEWLDDLPGVAGAVAGDADGADADGADADGADADGAGASGAVWARLDERAASSPDRLAFHDGATGRSVTFGELARSVERVAGRLADHGVGRGDRVAVLVPPSVELVVLVYACWRAGAVTVIADRGLGLGGLGRAVRGARVDAVVGERRALVAARTLRWAPRARSIDLDELVAAGPPTARPAGSGEGSDAVRAESGVDDLAAILFTSGATGPAKGVRYTHGQLARQRDALTELYAIAADDRFVAAFAPFALYGPALGITSAVPDVDVTRPGALTAEALDAACAAVDATMVFASPAALANVVRTANGPLPALGRVRTVMSAGAPVPVRTLRAMSALAPAAELHTPYGMTESLPVADVELDDLARVEGRGVCVGRPVPGCEVRIVALAGDGSSDPMPGDAMSALAVGATGEVLVRSPWTSAGYDGLWRTERTARPVDAAGRRWHRSGDVGHLDDDGRLWIEGRSVHVVRTVDGPVPSVPAEIAVERLDGVERAAVVGVGPSGVQRLVVVVETEDRRDRRAMFPPRRGPVRPVLASLELTGRVRAELAPLPIAAVCTVDALPTDIRHEAKIDRALVADRVGRLLAGRRP